MPLSEPRQPRQPLHTRAITFQGYEREDGLWEIEGHIVDTKSYGFPNQDRGRIEAGEPIHDLWLRLAIDETFTIREAEAAMDGTPFNYCVEIAPAFHALEGLTIESGWHREVAKRLGGVHGCTHLVELLRPMATAAVQTIMPARARRHPKSSDSPPMPPSQLNKCHSFADDGPIVKERMPEYYKGTDSWIDPNI